MNTLTFPFVPTFLDASGSPSLLSPGVALMTNLTVRSDTTLPLTGGLPCAYADLTDDGVTRLYLQFPLAFNTAALKQVTAKPAMGWTTKWYASRGRPYLCLVPDASYTLPADRCILLNLAELKLDGFPLQTMLPFELIYCVGTSKIQGEAELPLEPMGEINVLLEETVLYVSRAGESYADKLRINIQNHTDISLSGGEIQLTLYCETDDLGKYDDRAISSRDIMKSLTIAPDPTIAGWSVGIGPTDDPDDLDAMIWAFMQKPNDIFEPGSTIVLEVAPGQGLVCPLVLIDGRAATMCVAATFAEATVTTFIYRSLPLAELPPVDSQTTLALNQAAYEYGAAMNAGWALQFATHITLDWNDGINPRKWSSDTTDELTNIVAAFSKLPPATVPGTLTLRAWNDANRDRPVVQSANIDVPALAPMTATVDFPFATNLSSSLPVPITYQVHVSCTNLVKSVVLKLIDGSTQTLSPNGSLTFQYAIQKAGTMTAVVTFGTGVGQPDKVVTILCATADLVDLLKNHQWQDMTPHALPYCNYIGGLAWYEILNPKVWTISMLSCYGNGPPISKYDSGAYYGDFTLEGNNFFKYLSAGDPNNLSIILTNNALIFQVDGVGSFTLVPNQYPVPPMPGS